MSIYVIGDRRSTGYCIKCGTDLMIPWNDYQCCPECTEELEYHKKVAQARKGRAPGKKIMASRDIMRQYKRIGGIPE